MRKGKEKERERKELDWIGSLTPGVRKWGRESDTKRDKYNT